MTKIRHQIEVIIYTDTDEHPNITPLEAGTELAEKCNALLSNGLGCEVNVNTYYRGYDYPVSQH